MLHAVIRKRNIILILCAVILFALWLLTLILGSAEDKTPALVLSLLLPFVVYGLVRLMFKIVRINASPKFIKFGVVFFLLGGLCGAVINIAYFIMHFPNGLTPILGCCFGLMIAVLDEARKSAEAENIK